MHILLNLCVYCERLDAELAVLGLAESAESALEWVRLSSGTTVLLCEECIKRFAPNVRPYQEEGPIDFPPGITAIDHYCAELEGRGLLEDDCTVVLELEPTEGDFCEVRCPHCGIHLRSLNTKKQG
jgi:hypothetical protein